MTKVITQKLINIGADCKGQIIATIYQNLIYESNTKNRYIIN